MILILLSLHNYGATIQLQMVGQNCLVEIQLS